MSYPITFGKYLLLERINVGGMAEVFKAKAFGVEGFERILAIKRILPNMAEDQEFINMFIDEARIAVQLNHANIVPIYELGKFENQYYIAMEYVPGKDLRQILDRFRKKHQTLPIAAAAYITSQLCDGLDYAHRKGDASGRPLNLIHRDVSPQNVLVSYEGGIKITDFGIVKAEDRASKTQAGVLKGKFGYMSPEQVRGLEIDHRSDIFAVGILLYEMLTGKRLFIGESDFSTLEKVRNAEVPPPSEQNPLIPPALEQVMLKALARERDERYQSAADLHDDLQQFLIEENTVFNAKRLSALLTAEYQEDIQAEMQKMEEFKRMPPPSSAEALSAAEQMKAAPTRDWSDNRAEKTMIFESGFDDVANAQTLIGGGAEPMPIPRPPTQSTPEVERPAPPPPPKTRVGLWAAAGLAALVLLALGAYWWTSSSGTGTLVVTSAPIDTLDVYMDGELIGQKTPLVRGNVPVGEHTLLARASGFADKAYRFDLVAGAPAEIKVELERASGVAAPTEALLEVTSEPSMASVRMGGLPQGVTPVTLRNQDTTRPVILEISKPGFTAQTVTATFAPGEKKKTVHIKLVAAGEGVPATSGGAKLLVRSRPDHAAVFLGGVQRGITPVEIGDLDAKQTYLLEIAKDGFRSYEETIHMNGRASVLLEARLLPDRGARTKLGPPVAGCAGSGGKLSIMPVGVGDCKVTVGKVSLGVAPVFKKDSPVGRCPIDVKCPGGKHYQVVRPLRAGVEEKIIIKPDDWQ